MTRSSGRGGPLRVVLDTNVILSALLFGGTTSQLVPLWQTGRFKILLSRPILEEYLRALSYPKFELTDREVKALIHDEILPYSETVSKPSLTGVPFLKDPHDRKFLACARAAKADFLITGDKVLLSLRTCGRTSILSPREFLEEIS